MSTTTTAPTETDLLRARWAAQDAPHGHCSRAMGCGWPATGADDIPNRHDRGCSTPPAPSTRPAPLFDETPAAPAPARTLRGDLAALAVKARPALRVLTWGALLAASVLILGLDTPALP